MSILLSRIPWLQLSAGVAIFAAFVFAWNQYTDLQTKYEKLQFTSAVLAGQNALLQSSLKAEYTINNITQAAAVQAEKEVGNVQQIDAECGNGSELVDNWAIGLQRVRAAAAAADNSSE